jgi:hypothetical protein
MPVSTYHNALIGMMCKTPPKLALYLFNPLFNLFLQTAVLQVNRAGAL